MNKYVETRRIAYNEKLMHILAKADGNRNAIKVLLNNLLHVLDENNEDQMSADLLSDDELVSIHLRYLDYFYSKETLVKVIE